MATPKKSNRNYWLMKSEPDVFSFEDLIRAPRRTTHWEGVRNYQARNFMRDGMKVGDGVLVYHSNTDEPGVVGIGEIAREAYADEAALNTKSEYFDAKAKAKGENPWVVVDVKAKERLSEPVTRDRLRSHPGLAKMGVLQKGSRLSIQPVTEKEFEIVRSLGKSKAL